MNAVVTMQNQGQAVEVLTRAFIHDPVARWTYPDEEHYQRGFPAFIQAFAGRAFEHRTVYQAPGVGGAALWLPPDVHRDDEAVATVIEATLSGRRRDEVLALMVEMGQYHPSEPHWYLPLIGVDPAHHCRGVGTGLMRHGLELCDRNSTPAYLKATADGNRTLYERLGFRIAGMIQVASSPPIYPMIREPQPLN